MGTSKMSPEAGVRYKGLCEYGVEGKIESRPSEVNELNRPLYAMRGKEI
jgi:hypothetical protein